MDRGRAKGCISVRRLLHLQVGQGKTPTMIFLAKNLPGCRDAVRNDPDGTNRPIPTGNGPAPAKKFDGPLEELRQMYRRMTLESPPVEG
jgi:hypothetical protein